MKDFGSFCQEKPLSAQSLKNYWGTLGNNTENKAENICPIGKFEREVKTLWGLFMCYFDLVIYKNENLFP